LEVIPRATFLLFSVITHLSEAVGNAPPSLFPLLRVLIVCLPVAANNCVLLAWGPLLLLLLLRLQRLRPRQGWCLRLLLPLLLLLLLLCAMLSQMPLLPFGKQWRLSGRRGPVAAPLLSAGCSSRSSERWQHRCGVLLRLLRLLLLAGCRRGYMMLRGSCRAFAAAWRTTASEHVSNVAAVGSSGAALAERGGPQAE
jgi:hypothetical protein